MNSETALLPREDLVREGLNDLAQNRITEYALLVLVAAPRLQGLGLSVPERQSAEPFEHQLYTLLEERLRAGAHSHYNSLIRRIVSYARGLERERQRATAGQQ